MKMDGVAHLQPISSINFQPRKPSPPSALHQAHPFMARLKNLETSFRGFAADSHVDQPPPSAASSLLSGNLAPVTEECPPHECLPVIGKLPDALDGGIYLRNGSNPRYCPPNSDYHFFDGDGMLHAVKFESGAASYCCRYVRTSRLEQEEAAGRQLFPKIFGQLKGFRGLADMAALVMRSVLGSVDVTGGLGTANTGVVFFNGMLFATMEVDKPHVIRIRDDGDLETLGRYDFGGKLGHAMTEVPKTDPVTGEMFAFTNKLFLPPYLVFSRVSSDGVMQPPVAITTAEPALIHDFVITQNYAIIPENQLAFRLPEMLKGNSPICLDRGKVPRVGVIPRYAADESAIRWFPVPDLMCMHYPNAWEEGDEVVILGVGLLSPERVMADLDKMRCGLIQIRVNLKSGKVNKQLVCCVNGEKHQINTRYVGRKNRYVYFGAGSWPKLAGMYKLDLEADREPNRVVAFKKFEPGCYTSEPAFVPAAGDSGDCREDDGYLLCYLHNELDQTCRLLVMDASSPWLETVAEVRLPLRVPYGFHGAFISREELSTQQLSPDVLPRRHAKLGVADNLSRLLKFLVAT